VSLRAASITGQSGNAPARIPPTQLALWSFAIAIAHGAGLCWCRSIIGLCATPAHGHELAGPLVEASFGVAILVSIVDVAAMIAAGGYLAWLVYRYLGPKFVSRSWFNLETSWAVSLVLVGAVALAFDLAR
jgi:hypothetical protein